MKKNDINFLHSNSFFKTDDLKLSLKNVKMFNSSQRDEKTVSDHQRYTDHLVETAIKKHQLSSLAEEITKHCKDKEHCEFKADKDLYAFRVTNNNSIWTAKDGKDGKWSDIRRGLMPCSHRDYSCGGYALHVIKIPKLAEIHKYKHNIWTDMELPITRKLSDVTHPKCIKSIKSIEDTGFKPADQANPNISWIYLNYNIALRTTRMINY